MQICLRSVYDMSNIQLSHRFIRWSKIKFKIFIHEKSYLKSVVAFVPLESQREPVLSQKNGPIQEIEVIGELLRRY